MAELSSSTTSTKHHTLTNSANWLTEVASQAGGWQFTGLATGALAMAGLVFSALLVRHIQAGRVGSR